MQAKYEQAIKETFKYLDDYLSNPENIVSSYGEMIKAHMKLKGYRVYCTTDAYGEEESVVVYPLQDNLPIHIWRR